MVRQSLENSELYYPWKQGMLDASGLQFFQNDMVLLLVIACSISTSFRIIRNLCPFLFLATDLR